MAEQNLIAVAAGLARTGKIAVRHDLRRLRDPPRLRFHRHRLRPQRGSNVKIFAGLPGLTTGYGGTHQAIEDLALMRMIPGLVVIDPCDATEIAAGDARRSPSIDGPVYMRLLRGNVPVVLDPATYRFEIGKAQPLRDGRGRRHHRDRLDDRARARRRRARWPAQRHRGRRAARADDQAVRRRRRRRIRRLGRPASSSPRTTSVAGGLASLVAEALFDARRAASR